MLTRLTSVPIAYLLVWCGSLALTIALVVLLRTRWGQSRPLHKCAVLSLLVHLLLAWAAMTLRIVTGDGGGGEGGVPIRVHIVQDSSAAPLVANISAAPALEDAPPLIEPPALEPPATPADDVDAQMLDVADAAPVAEADAPQSIEHVADTQATTNAPAAPDETETEANIHPQPAPTEPIASADHSPHRSSDTSQVTTTDVASTPVAPQPAAVEPTYAASASTPYSLRNAPGRLGLVEHQGGSGQTEAAVVAALRWLANAQSRDGRWNANQYAAGQEQMVLGHNRGAAGRNADTGISALALLAFLGAGYSHQAGEYQETVQRGLDFLLRSQAADGNLFGNATFYAQMYCHSMATFALAEAQAMTGDRRLEPAVSKAAGFCTTAQNSTTGGWRYRAGETDAGDTSQLGWQLMALASAERAGIRIPSNTWGRAERFLRSVRRGNYGGLASYRPDSGASTPMTAEALYCRLLLGEVTGEPIDDAVVAEATSQLLSALPNAQRINLYYWYYATLALHHRHQRDDKAAAAWHSWNDALAATLVETQVTVGPDAGSWNTNTVWGGYGGRVYTTATAAMCLEAYYRYAPSPRPQDRWTATRPGPQNASH